MLNIVRLFLLSSLNFYTLPYETQNEEKSFSVFPNLLIKVLSLAIFYPVSDSMGEPGANVPHLSRLVRILAYSETILETKMCIVGRSVFTKVGKCTNDSPAQSYENSLLILPYIHTVSSGEINIAVCFKFYI